MPDIVDLIMADHEQSQKVAAVRSAMTTWAAKAAEAEHRNTIFFLDAAYSAKDRERGCPGRCWFG